MIWKRVLGTTQSNANALIKVYAQGKLALMPTPEHPFWIEGRWKSAVELTRGDSLWLHNGQKVAIDSTVRIDTVVQVYNFEVEDFHTYFVGEWGVGVHNSCINNNLANILCQIYGIQQPDDLAKALDKKFKTQLNKLENLLKDENFQKAVNILNNNPQFKINARKPSTKKDGVYERIQVTPREAFFWDFIWGNKTGEVNFFEGFTNFVDIYNQYMPENLAKFNFMSVVLGWQYLQEMTENRSDYKNVLMASYFLFRKGGLKDNWKGKSYDVLRDYQKKRKSNPEKGTVIPPMEPFYLSSLYILYLGNYDHLLIYRDKNSVKSKISSMINKNLDKSNQFGLDWHLELTARLFLGGSVPNIRKVQLSNFGVLKGQLAGFEKEFDIQTTAQGKFTRVYDIIIKDENGLSYRIDSKNTINLDKNTDFADQIISDIELGLEQVGVGNPEPNVFYLFKKRDGILSQSSLVGIAVRRIIKSIQERDKHNNPKVTGVKSYEALLQDRLASLGYGNKDKDSLKKMLDKFLVNKIHLVMN